MKDYGSLGALFASTLCRGPKGAQAKVKVSPGIAALHSNNPQVSVYSRSLYASGPTTAILSETENTMTSHRVKERKWTENKTSTGGSGCRKRNERSTNTRGFTDVAKSVLQSTQMLLFHNIFLQ